MLSKATISNKHRFNH